MLTPAAAEKLILENIVPFKSEDCPLASAQQRILRQAIKADRDLPPFHRVTMDGFALRAAAIAAGLSQFKVERVQAAGMRPFQLSVENAACIEVMTGAVLPEGADTVVPYEDTLREGADINLMRGHDKFQVGHAVHHRGTDHRAGDVIVSAGTLLSGREIAVAAACGYASLSVSLSPKIAIVATGDELVEVDAPAAAHQIRRSNDYAVRAALITAGFSHVSRFHLRDVRHEIEHLLWHILAEFDVVIISGGVSKGKFDYLPAELERQGVKKFFHGVAQRPGKPFWFGLSARQTPVFALPGNPVSTYTCLHRYVLPALAYAGGLLAKPVRRVALAAPVVFKPKLTWLLPVKLVEGRPGEWLAQPDPSNTSGDFAGLIGTDGIVELAAEPTSFLAGSIVPFYPWI